MNDFKVAVFASGSGTNFQAMIDQVESGQLDVKIELLVCDREGAPVIQRAHHAGIETLVLAPKSYATREAYESVILERLQEKGIELIVLAGYMRLITAVLLDAFPLRIINIHPSLLPAFPGKDGVRDAWTYGAKVTGCTVHFVDAGVDTGPIIAQQVVEVRQDDTVQSLHEQIHQAEQAIYPRVIQWIREGRVSMEGRKVRIKEA
ncbi:phosphoribosylglycinamide formyltransferase [Marinicrinis sediminis]|uniref:Phosphoribosylglycinamide formyltransferase n=1 Tax=Marinicrinis sediminis TaxID=1652465 RepID=A0ABW5RAV7_9BACL